MTSTTSRLTVPGADLALRRWPGREAAANGRRRTLTCLHETGATAACWRTLADHLVASELAADLVAFDRRGWGDSTAPEPYIRTTVAEQAQDALAVLDHLGLAQAGICGAGLGAVAAIDLALREPDRVEVAVAIEPPLLALVDGATEGLSQDADTLRKAFEGEEGGRAAVAELVLKGELPYLAPGAERLPAREATGGGDGREVLRNPGTLFAELGAVPAWPLPFEQLATSPVPILVVTGSETSAPLRAAAAALVGFAPSAQHLQLPEPDPLLAASLSSQLAL